MTDAVLGKLYLVPTPIGNLEDITYRAVRCLETVDKILAEDTRKSRILLQHYGIDTPLLAHHAHNEHQSVEKIIHQLTQGISFAVISDAGTPGISDPGFLLARTCIEAGIPIEVLPGATAFVPALLLSGFSNHAFTFLGFLPPKKGRKKKLEKIKEAEDTLILYESPHKINKTLLELKELLGEDRKVSLSRELTKKFEETLRAPLGELCEQLQTKKIKGELVLVIEAKKK